MLVLFVIVLLSIQVGVDVTVIHDRFVNIYSVIFQVFIFYLFLTFLANVKFMLCVKK